MAPRRGSIRALRCHLNEARPKLSDGQGEVRRVFGHGLRLGLRGELVSQAGSDGAARVERCRRAFPGSHQFRRLACGGGDDRDRQLVERLEVGKESSQRVRSRVLDDV